MCKILLKHLRKSQDLRLKASVYGNKAKHDHAKCILKLCMLIKLVQDNICIGISAEVDADAHSLTAGVVIQVCDSVNLLVADKFCDLFDQTGFVYEVWKFCDNNA